MSATEVVDYIKSIYDGELIENVTTLCTKPISILIPEKKLAISYQNVASHAEQSGYTKYVHRDMSDQCAKNDTHLVHLWENEWLFKRDIVESRLNNFVGKSQRIFARKCKIIPLDPKQMKQFFDQGHIQHNHVAKIGYGLVYKRPEDGRPWLVAGLSMSKSRYSNKFEWELIRYANTKGTSVTGGASKLFKHFIKKHNPKSILTYTDRRWNRGILYERLGFKLSHIADPNYFYFKPPNYEVLQSRVQYQKHKLEKKLKTFDPNLTEYVNMLNNGFDRIHDVGNLVYHLLDPKSILK